jgi:choline dehydrogenase
VGDERWSYNGQLPWMKKSESWFDDTNPEQHGSDGPMQISSVGSTNRRYPLREPLASGWDELGVPVLPNLDSSAGDNFGRANLTETRRNGLRLTAATAYPLEGVTLLTDTLVKKVVLDCAGSTPKASGVELGNGTILKSKNVILSAGTLRTPQLLMLSGVGPSAHLKDVGVEPVVDVPEVGQGLTDHMSFFQHWRVRDDNEGLTLGSDNPMFQQPEIALGIPTDFLVNTDVPKAGLAEAIEKDDGVKPDMLTHPLLNQTRSFTETFMTYVKIPFPGTVPDTHHITSDVVSFLPTSRGSITLRSTNHEDTPKSTSCVSMIWSRCSYIDLWCSS